MRLEVISTVSEGEVNDCYLAREMEGGDGSLFTLLVIRDHETVRSLLEIFSMAALSGDEGDGPLIDSFSSEQSYVLVFPYRSERPVDDFFVGEVYSLEKCEEICSNLILACISCALPFPILDLILSQKKINISRDGGIYFSYALDLKELDKTRTERDCTTRCAEILLDLLSSKEDEKNVTYQLLSKKVANRSYNRFTEAYRDLKIASAPTKKSRIIVRIKSFFHRNADQLFGILFWVSLIVGIVALVLFLSHMFVGDIPFFRIFFNSFKNIGTESLLK
ncbi:MAG: hypothetical protein K5985_07960 [Lachnospiraceae bacterium]|nr:hypothetical protein [Lachnospiraceae bacterium]